MSEFDGLEGEPIAPMVGSFPHRSFLEVWRRHRPAGAARVIATATASLPLVVVGETARIAGEPHLTDYHSPLGTDLAGLGRTLLDVAPRLVLDSLPVEAADPLQAELERAGATVERVPDGVCMVLDLDGSEQWESALGSKDRHEVRRKRRRFSRRHREGRVEQAPGEFGRFVDLHRRSDGPKGDFLSDSMVAFFEDLLALPGWRLDALRGGDGDVFAVGVGFEDEDAHYLYNSAFDPDAAEAAPGLVLIDQLIGGAAATGKHRFDFLRGAEGYKRRMGAVERPLYRLEVRS